MLAPVGAVTVIVPVAVPQLGCAVTLAVGATGVAGAVFTVKAVTEDTQPLVVFLLVTL
jgi:hypothetical protein